MDGNRIYARINITSSYQLTRKGGGSVFTWLNTTKPNLTQREKLVDVLKIALVKYYQTTLNLTRKDGIISQNRPGEILPNLT